MNDLEKLLCASCGYDLAGLPDSGVCPECGHAIGLSIKHHKMAGSITEQVESLKLLGVACLIRDGTIACSIVVDMILGFPLTVYLAVFMVGVMMEFWIHLLLQMAQREPVGSVSVSGKKLWLLMIWSLSIGLIALLAGLVIPVCVCLTPVLLPAYLVLRVLVWMAAIREVRKFEFEPQRRFDWDVSLVLAPMIPALILIGLLAGALLTRANVPSVVAAIAPMLVLTVMMVRSYLLVRAAKRFLSRRASPP